MKKIAIIGAGFSGLTLANALRDKMEITIFEKARGVGGRMATRYAGDFTFDHGAPFFSARSQQFREFLQPFIEKEIVAPWRGHWADITHDKSVKLREFTEDLLVACPNMNSLCKNLIKNLSIQLACEVAPIEHRENNQWHLHDKIGIELGIYDWVISTAPLEQTQALFSRHLSPDNLRTSLSTSCYVLMLGIKHAWPYEWVAANIDSAVIKNIFVNSSKPNRSTMMTSLVIHAQPAWSQSYLNDDITLIEQRMVQEVKKFIDIDAIEHRSTHRWRYAQHASEKIQQLYLQPTLGLAAMGDWCAGAEIEDVWHSAKAFASCL